MLRRLAKWRLHALFTPKYYLTLCCIIKDENSYLEEWMRYHLKTGVQHFYIYDNGSKIPVVRTLEELGLATYATVVLMPGRSKQKEAYEHCLKHFGYNSRWIGFIDTDEFIVPKATGGNLPQFLKSYERYGGLGINWLVFGSSGHVQRTHQSQLSSFTLRSDLTFKENCHIKSIVQPRHVRYQINPHAFRYRKRKFCVNENCVPIADAFSVPSVEKIQLNHYYCRSLEEYRDKIRRGRADDSNLIRKEQDFRRHDESSNLVRDTEILNFV